MQSDPRLDQAKAMPITDIVGMLQIQGLRRAGIEQMGPCPVCGGVDRFSINMPKNLFNCRHCGGGDGIKLVELVQGCDFKAALAFLCGEADVSLDPEEVKRRRKRAAEQRERSEAENARYRAKAISDAKKIWRSAGGQTRDTVADYFALRGIKLDQLPRCFRFIFDRKYYQQTGHAFTHIHTGPCMITAIAQPNGTLSAVHQTWLDLSQKNGKAKILGKGEKLLDSKKVRGSKKGGAIRLTGELMSNTLVMGEGIETTLTAMMADSVPGAMYWAGVDLGNMSGRMQRIEGKKWSGLPDMSDSDAFYPPPCVERLIFIQDGDSQPRMTRAKLESGIKRHGA